MHIAQRAIHCQYMFSYELCVFSLASDLKRQFFVNCWLPRVCRCLFNSGSDRLNKCQDLYFNELSCPLLKTTQPHELSTLVLEVGPQVGNEIREQKIQEVTAAGVIEL